MGDANADANGDPIQSFWYMYVFPGGGSQRTKKEDTVEIEKKSKTFIHSLIPKKKEKEKTREYLRNSWFHIMPTSQNLPVRSLVFVSFVLAFIPLLPIYRHTDRSRPIFCLYLALTYMDLLSRTVLSVELDENEILLSLSSSYFSYLSV